MIRKATLPDFKKISIIHAESYKNHFLQKLGLDLLANYYKEFIEDNDIFLVNVDDNDEINGFLVGTPSPSKGRSNFIKNNKIKLLLKILRLSISFDKDTWGRILEHVRPYFLKKHNESIKIDPTIHNLLSICVSEKCKGKGVADTLIKEYEKELTKIGYSSYILFVYKANERANHFYKKVDMKVYGETLLEYIYIKDLLNC